MCLWPPLEKNGCWLAWRGGLGRGAASQPVTKRASATGGNGSSRQSAGPWPPGQAPAHPPAGAEGPHTLGLCPLGQKSTRKQCLCRCPQPPTSRKGSLGMRPSSQGVTGRSRVPGPPNSGFPPPAGPVEPEKGHFHMQQAGGSGSPLPWASTGRASVPGPPDCSTLLLGGGQGEGTPGPGP